MICGYLEQSVLFPHFAHTKRFDMRMRSSRPIYFKLTLIFQGSTYKKSGISVIFVFLTVLGATTCLVFLSVPPTLVLVIK